jgi:GNAT superfamily N-acetyltransferase
MTESFIAKNCVTVEGSKRDLDILAKYHYQPPLNMPITRVYKLIGTGSYRDVYPDPLSVVAYIQPLPECSGRTKATSGYFHQYESHADNLRLLNQCVLYLSRLITDPRFLRRGLATKLVKESLELLDIPIVETMTPIDFTNQLYQNCGFELYYMAAPLKYKRLLNAFRQVGVTLTETTSPQLVEMRLSSLPRTMSNYIETEITHFLGGFRNADRFVPGLERTKYILTKIPPPEAYLIWFNPQSETTKEIHSFVLTHKTPGGER